MTLRVSLSINHFALEKLRSLNQSGEGAGEGGVFLCSRTEMETPGPIGIADTSADLLL